MNLSRNAKESLKTALAMTIAYGISLQMGWDRPYWAGFAVAFISLPTIGQSLNKATLRLAGTILGAIMALTVLSLAAQNRWLFITLVVSGAVSAPTRWVDLVISTSGTCRALSS